jgi:uncharacterized protein (DUF302 family)
MVNNLADVLKKELNMTFDEAVTHIEKVLGEQGFTVLMTKSIDEIFKIKLSITDYPRYTTILACNASLAKMALDASFNGGLLFPCSFVVYEQDGKIIVSHISIMKATEELGLVPSEDMAAVIKASGEMVHAAWDKF